MPYFKHLVDIRPPNPSNNFACKQLVQTCHVTEFSLAKTAEYLRLVYTKTVDSVKRAR